MPRRQHTVLLGSALCVLYIFFPARYLWGGEEVPRAKPVAFELVIYDLRWATSPVTDFPSPLLSASAPAGGNPFFVQPANGVLAASDLACLIKERILPQEFLNPDTSIEEANGKLVVMQRPAVHAAIKKIVAELAARIQRRVCVQALEVGIEPELAVDWFGRGGRPVGKSEIEALLKPDAGATLVSAPQQVLFNKQRGHILAGKTSNYVADADVAGATYDPTVRTLLEGVVMEAHPTLDADGARVFVDFKFSRRSLAQAPARLPIEVLAYSRGVETTKRFAPVDVVEGKEKQVQENAQEKNPVKLVEEKTSIGVGVPVSRQSVVLEMPKQHVRDLQTTLRVPVGNWVLAGTLDPLPGAAKGSPESKVLLVLLRCDTVGEQPGTL